MCQEMGVSLASMLKAPKEGAGEADWLGAGRVRPGRGAGRRVRGARGPGGGPPTALGYSGPQAIGDTGMRLLALPPSPACRLSRGGFYFVLGTAQ